MPSGIDDTQRGIEQKAIEKVALNPPPFKINSGMIELFKMIPRFGRLVDLIDKASKLTSEEELALTSVNQAGTFLWELNKERLEKTESLEWEKKRANRRNIVAGMESDLKRIGDNIQAMALKLRSAVEIYEDAVRRTFQSKQQFVAAIRKYANDSVQSFSPPPKP